MTPKKRRKANLVKAPDFTLDDSTAYMARDLLRIELKLLKDRLSPWGMVLGHFLYLRALWEKDGVTQRELGRRIGVNDASSRVALEGMEKQGLVRRNRNAKDMRKIVVFLTPKGKELKRDLLPIAREVNEIFMQDFSSSEALLFRSFLFRARKSLEVAAHTSKVRKVSSS